MSFDPASDFDPAGRAVTDLTLDYTPTPGTPGQPAVNFTPSGKTPASIVPLHRDRKIYDENGQPELSSSGQYVLSEPHAPGF